MRWAEGAKTQNASRWQLRRRRKPIFLEELRGSWLRVNRCGKQGGDRGGLMWRTLFASVPSAEDSSLMKGGQSGAPGVSPGAPQVPHSGPNLTEDLSTCILKQSPSLKISILWHPLTQRSWVQKETHIQNSCFGSLFGMPGKLSE